MQTIQVALKDIIVKPGRGRTDFARLAELAESLKTKGFVHPICVTQQPDYPGKYVLVAGERRYRASMIAGFSQIPVTLREGLSTLDQTELELIENIDRIDLAWPEQCELMRQIDELKRTTVPEWTAGKTAELVQVSPAFLSEQISIAKRLKADPKLAQEIRHLPMYAAIKAVQRKDEAAKCERLVARGELLITTDLRLGSCVPGTQELKTASVDLLLTDPPYGLDKLEAIREGGGAKLSGHQLMSESHNQTIDQVLTLLRQLAPELYRVLKPGAHAYVFCSFQHAQAFITALEPLEVQYPPIIWRRNKSTSPGYGYNYLNLCEYILMFHRPERSRRLAKSMWNVLDHPEVPSNLRRYPTEKPESLLSDLINQSTVPGEMVLDLFAGSGSTLSAARKLGRRSLGFEINPESWQRAQLFLAGVTSPTDGQASLLDTPAKRKASAEFGVVA